MCVREKREIPRLKCNNIVEGNDRTIRNIIAKEALNINERESKKDFFNTFLVLDKNTLKLLVYIVKIHFIFG